MLTTIKEVRASRVGLSGLALITVPSRRGIEVSDLFEDVENPWADQEAVKRITGLYTNRIFVQHLGDGMLRLNFGEILDPDDPSYHTALVISAGNAKAFAELIVRQANAALGLSGEQTNGDS